MYFFRNFRESHSKICIVQNIFHIFANPVQCVFGRCVLRKKHEDFLIFFINLNY